jgi:hypothetical protein
VYDELNFVLLKAEDFLQFLSSRDKKPIFNIAEFRNSKKLRKMILSYEGFIFD